jgi:hypothetical protein
MIPATPKASKNKKLYEIWAIKSIKVNKVNIWAIKCFLAENRAVKTQVGRQVFIARSSAQESSRVEYSEFCAL